MAEKGLRYFALGSGTALTGLLVLLDKIDPVAAVGVVIAILGIAGADMVKHRNDIQ